MMDEGSNTLVVGLPAPPATSPGKLGRDTVQGLTARAKAANVAAAAIGRTLNYVDTAERNNPTQDHASPVLPEETPTQQVAKPPPAGGTLFARSRSPLRQYSGDTAATLLSTGTRGHLGSRDFYVSPHYMAEDGDIMSNDGRTTRLSWAASLAAEDPRKSPQPPPFSSISHVKGDNSQMNFVETLCPERNSPTPTVNSRTPTVSLASQSEHVDDESVTIDEDQLPAVGVNDVSVLVTDRKERTVLLRFVEEDDGRGVWDIPSGPIDPFVADPVYAAASKAVEDDTGFPAASDELLLLLRIDTTFGQAVVEMPVASRAEFEAKCAPSEDLQFFPADDLPEAISAKAELYCEEWIDGLRQMLFEEASVASPVLPFSLIAHRFPVQEEEQDGAIDEISRHLEGSLSSGDLDSSSAVSALSTLGC